MTVMFPHSAIAAMQSAKYDPAAKPGLELLSGTLIWDDECYHEFVANCIAAGCRTYWQPVLYRSKLIMGKPDDDESRPGWDDLRRACPNWPGFRPERSSESWRPLLEQMLSEEP